MAYHYTNFITLQYIAVVLRVLRYTNDHGIGIVVGKFVYCMWLQIATHRRQRVVITAITTIVIVIVINITTKMTEEVIAVNAGLLHSL